jgi:Skp family chaperone for outer membrane proteins
MRPESKMARWAMAAVVLLAVVGIAAIPTDGNDRTVQGGVSVAYVNADIILRQTPGFAAADSTLRSDLQVYEGEITQLRQELDSAVAAYDQQEILLSPAAKEEKIAELQTMQQRGQTRQQELQTRAVQREQELLAPLQLRIQTVIDGIRAERNIAIIFDVASPETNIISADPTLNLTPLVVERVQSTGGP